MRTKNTCSNGENDCGEWWGGIFSGLSQTGIAYAYYDKGEVIHGAHSLNIQRGAHRTIKFLQIRQCVSFAPNPKRVTSVAFGTGNSHFAGSLPTGHMDEKDSLEHSSDGTVTKKRCIPRTKCN